jgi:hypothetical protein
VLDRVSSEHVDMTSTNAFAMLGFIRRLSLELDPYTLKFLYTSLTRSKVEYASCVWNPFYDVRVDRVKCVLRRFFFLPTLKMLCGTSMWAWCYNFVVNYIYYQILNFCEPT